MIFFQKKLALQPMFNNFEGNKRAQLLTCSPTLSPYRLNLNEPSRNIAKQNSLVPFINDRKKNLSQKVKKSEFTRRFKVCQTQYSLYCQMCYDLCEKNVPTCVAGINREE